jgi:transcriptional regulator with XRE-family HTH domain
LNGSDTDQCTTIPVAVNTRIAAERTNMGETPQETFAQRVFRARLRLQAELGREVSTTDVGALLGVSGVTVGRWERGDRTPDLEMIAKLAEALRTTPEWLAFGVRAGDGAAPKVNGTVGGGAAFDPSKLPPGVRPMPPGEPAHVAAKRMQAEREAAASPRRRPRKGGAA